MSRKPRPESLWAHLKTPENRDQVLEWLITEGVSYEECSARCAEHFGLSPSPGALKTFYESHGFTWKIELAKIAAERSKHLLPADWEAQKKMGLAQREFEMAFRELSVKEVYALKSLELEQERLRLNAEFGKKKLEQKDTQLAQAQQSLALTERRVKLLEENQAKAKAALEQVKSAGGMTPETLKIIEEAAKLL